MAGPEGISIQKNKLFFYHEMRGISENEISNEEIELTPKQISKLSKFIDKMEIWDWYKDYDKFHLFHPLLDGYNWKIKIEIDNKKVSSKGYEIYPDNFFKLLKYFDKEFGTNFYDKDWEKGDLENNKIDFKFNYTIPLVGEIKIYNKNKSLIYESVSWSKDINPKRKKIFICHPLIQSFWEFFNHNRLWYLEKDINKQLEIEGFEDGDLWELKANFTDKKVNSKGRVIKFESWDSFVSFLNNKFETDMMKDIGNE